MGKSGVLEHKSGNISETRKDRGKVTMEGLYELTNALSNGTIPDPYSLLIPKIGDEEAVRRRGSGMVTKNFNRYYLRNG